jgi:hypothetical protein
MLDVKTASFPRLDIPEKEKNEDWYKQFVQSISNQSITPNFDFSYFAINESYNFFQGLQSGDEFKFLQEAEDGEVLPAKWININSIRPKFETVIGEFMSRGYDIRVRALNKEAVSRRLEEKHRLLVEMRLAPDAQMLEMKYQMPFQTGEQLPEDEEQLDEFMEETYKETSEFVMETALKWLGKRNNWESIRRDVFTDVWIAGRGFVKSEIINGLPVLRRVDPRLMIFDPNSQDDFLTDSTYFGEVQYMNIADAVAKYNLNEKEIKEVLHAGKDATHNRSFVGVAFTEQGKINFFRMDGGQLRVLVVTAYWVDYKYYNHRKSVDKYGQTHYKRVPDTERGKDIERRRVKVWRKATLIGDKILKDYGLMENMARNVDSLAETEPPYKAILPFFINGHTISKVHQLKGLQNLKDMTMYNVSLAMARAGAKGFIYDVSQVPENWDIHNVIKYLKTVGIGFIDSKRDGLPANYNQFQTIDMTISNTLTQYLTVMDKIDREMDVVSGINEARQGTGQGSSQTVGVTQAQLMQSNFTTAPYFKLFHIFASKCWSHQAQLVKLSWVDKEQFAPIIGDVGVDFINEDIELDLNDYGVFVEELPMILDDIQTFHQIVMAGIQSGSIDFVAGMKMLREKDVTVGMRKFERYMQKKEEEMASQQQAQMEQEERMLDKQLQLQMAIQDNKAENSINNTMLKERLRGQIDRQNIYAKGHVDLTGKKMDILKEMAMPRPVSKPPARKT